MTPRRDVPLGVGMGNDRVVKSLDVGTMPSDVLRSRLRGRRRRLRLASSTSSRLSCCHGILGPWGASVGVRALTRTQAGGGGAMIPADLDRALMSCATSRAGRPRGQLSSTRPDLGDLVAGRLRTRDGASRSRADLRAVGLRCEDIGECDYKPFAGDVDAGIVLSSISALQLVTGVLAAHADVPAPAAHLPFSQDA